MASEALRLVAAAVQLSVANASGRPIQPAPASATKGDRPSLPSLIYPDPQQSKTVRSRMRFFGCAIVSKYVGGENESEWRQSDSVWDNVAWHRGSSHSAKNAPHFLRGRDWNHKGLFRGAAIYWKFRYMLLLKEVFSFAFESSPFVKPPRL